MEIPGFEARVSCWRDIIAEDADCVRYVQNMILSQDMEVTDFPFDKITLDPHGRLHLLCEYGVLMLQAER